MKDAASAGRVSLQPKLSNARAFLAKGYSFRELAFKAISVKIYSRILSHARHRFRARGKGVDIDHRAVVDGAGYIELAEDVFVQRGAWLVVPLFDMPSVEDRAYLMHWPGHPNWPELPDFRGQPHRNRRACTLRSECLRERSLPRL